MEPEKAIRIGRAPKTCLERVFERQDRTLTFGKCSTSDRPHIWTHPTASDRSASTGVRNVFPIDPSGAGLPA
jgi:hypothetical protein